MRHRRPPSGNIDPAQVLNVLNEAAQRYLEQQKQQSDEARQSELDLIVSILPKRGEKRLGLTRKQIVAQTGIYPADKVSQRLDTLRQQGKAKLALGRYWRQT